MATMPKDAQDLFDNLVPEGLKQYPDKFNRRIIGIDPEAGIMTKTCCRSCR